MPGGSWLGALASGILTDRVGRKGAIQIGSVIWYALAVTIQVIYIYIYIITQYLILFLSFFRLDRVIGSIICCASVNIAMLIVGRVINGLAVGICSAQVPVYISELAPPTKRGRVVGAQQWAITWGELLTVAYRRLKFYLFILYFLCLTVKKEF